jgi:hypothetical protein
LLSGWTLVDKKSECLGLAFLSDAGGHQTLLGDRLVLVHRDPRSTSGQSPESPIAVIG